MTSETLNTGQLKKDIYIKDEGSFSGVTFATQAAIDMAKKLRWESPYKDRFRLDINNEDLWKIDLWSKRYNLQLSSEVEIQYPHDYDPEEHQRYRLSNLATIDEKGTVSSPFSPGQVLNNLAEAMGATGHGLFRIHFNENRYYQILEEGEGWTSYDTLIVNLKYKNGIASFFIIDADKVIPMFSYFDGKLEKLDYYQDFQHQLTEIEIEEMLQKANQLTFQSSK